MSKELVIIDAKGDKQQVELSVSMYREAAEADQTLPQLLASRFPTNAERDGTAFEQLMEQTGIMVRGNKEFGLRPSTLSDILSPKDASSGAVTREGTPVSRTLFPAVLLSVVEDKLAKDYATNPSALSAMVAIDESIPGERFERPVISFALVEEARGQAVAQLALPNAIMKITSSDRFQKIPTWGVGMEISDQAMKSTTIDLVSLALARQLSVETNERANTQILSFLQGDLDTGFGGAALSTISGKVKKAVDYDASIAAAGTLTQKAWISWLSANQNKRQITHIVTDVTTAMAIEGRTGKPTNFNDNPNSPRIDTTISVMNPKWPTNVQIFITNDANWPANTVMGFDKRAAIHRVTSLSAAYSAVEEFAMKRSQMMRVDRGDYAYRLFDEAFEVLTLTL